MFTIEELSILALLCDPALGREKAISTLLETLPLITENDIRSTVIDVIDGLDLMTDDDFLSLDFSEVEM